MARRKPSIVKVEKSEVSRRRRTTISGVFRTSPVVDGTSAIDAEWTRLSEEAVDHWFVNVG